LTTSFSVITIPLGDIWYFQAPIRAAGAQARVGRGPRARRRRVRVPRLRGILPCVFGDGDGFGLRLLPGDGRRLRDRGDRAIATGASGGSRIPAVQPHAHAHAGDQHQGDHGHGDAADERPRGP